MGKTLRDLRRYAAVDRDFADFARDRYFAEKNSNSPDPQRLAKLQRKLNRAAGRASDSYDMAHRFDNE